MSSQRAQVISTSSPSEPSLRLGVSACLIGQQVRFDGQHKRDAFVVDQLGRFMTLLPICPEVEVGMSIPRETVRLERRGRALAMVAPASGTDWTERMTTFARERVLGLADLDLSGYVVKKDSPSCGLERVKVYPSAAQKGAAAERTGRGLFTQALTAAYPLLPIEEEGRLHDPRLREAFVERVFAYRRVVDLFRTRWTVGDLVAFHTREKLLLLCHDEPAYRALGQLVARAKREDRAGIALAYQTTFMAALAKLATIRKHTNVLQHMAGFVKTVLDPADKAELAQTIADFHKSLVPLVVPITLLRHHARKHQVSYLLGQTYLEPHPKELMLRNHV
jgi:uncharacterized protein YbgA (DUF1722 family)/uncharacterized protein YbbK (DUF523 family)